jgi:hypothetical protein
VDNYTRTRILSTIGCKGRVPGDCTWKHLVVLQAEGLVEGLGWPRFQLTEAGRAELEAVGREALQPQTES